MNTTNYTIRIANLSTQYIGVQVEIISPENQINLIFPDWRPGRYELGNFSKNIKNLKIYDDNFKIINHIKISKNEWKIDTTKTSKIHIDYLYHSSELNAGSTFVNEEQLYINPINCLIYKKNNENFPCELSLKIPKNWKIACALKIDNNSIKADSYHQLVDSPLIASSNLQHNSYQIEKYKFNIWFQGEITPDWNKLITDFKKFTEKQLFHFGDFPFEEYHFLFQIVPYDAYHGVEHLNSTVILLGPSYEIFNQLYTELLGVSSHELYHVWNVKSIKPTDFYEYDYSKENYSKLGFVYEGVTTYLGDQFLLKSNVFSIEQYTYEMTKNIQRHFDNFGRLTMPVTDASFDTWLDGYVLGAPNRKTSIYIEGALIAFISDIQIMKATQNKKSLNTVMKNLYLNYSKQNKGYTIDDYKNELEKVSDCSFEKIFNELIYGTYNYESYICDALNYIGFELKCKKSSKISESYFGVKTFVQNKVEVVKKLYPGSDFEQAGIMLEDKLIGINQIAIHQNFEKWCNYFKNNTNISILVERKGKLLNLSIPINSKEYFLTYNIKKIENMSKAQREAFNFWKK